MTHGSATDVLTDREKEVLEFIALGLGDKEIAREMALAPSTVRNHINSIFRKYGVTNRARAVIVGLARDEIRWFRVRPETERQTPW